MLTRAINMAEVDALPLAGVDRMTVNVVVDPLNSSYHSHASGPSDVQHHDVGVQTDLLDTPTTPLRGSPTPNLINFSPSPPRTPPPRQPTSVLTSTPPSRAATPTPTSYSLRTPTKRSAYMQLSQGRPRSKTLLTFKEDHSVQAAAVEEMHLRSFAGIPPSKLHIPRPLELMEDDQDVFVAHSTELALSLGRRVVSNPSTVESVIPTTFTRPRAASDSLAALAYAAVLQEADMLASLQDAESTNSVSGVSLSHSRSVSSGFSDSSLSTSSLTSLDTDDELETIHVPRIRRGSCEFASTESTMSEAFQVDDKAEDSVVSEPSPPKSIPALHGPLSLPYARCPSGAEGIIIEEPGNMHKVVWGLAHERRNSEPGPVPSGDTTLSAVTQDELEPSTTIMQEAVRAMPRFCGLVRSDGLAQRRAADLGIRRRTYSSPATATHSPTKATNSMPQSFLRPNAPSFYPGIPQTRRVTLDPSTFYLAPSMPLQSPIMLASEPDTYTPTEPHWHTLYDDPSNPLYPPFSTAYANPASFMPSMPAFNALSTWSVPYSAENLGLLQRLTMCAPSNLQGNTDPRTALGHGRPSSLPSQFGDKKPMVARRVTNAISRPRMVVSPPTSAPAPRPGSRLGFAHGAASRRVGEDIQIITTPATPVTPVFPCAPVNIDQNLLQANDVARAAARAWGVPDNRASTPALGTNQAGSVDWPSSFKQFWQEQQAARTQEQLTADLPESPTREHPQAHYRRPMITPPNFPTRPRSVPMLRLINRRGVAASLPTLPETNEDAVGYAPKRIPSGPGSASSEAPTWQRPQSSTRRTPSPSGRGSLTPQTKTDAEDPDKVDGWVVRLPQPSLTAKASGHGASSPVDEDVIIFQGTRAKDKGKGKAAAPASDVA
ncbi:hypothetical protein CALCODRAFT_303663 [Calocera cornea HHB12733]|uniref:Uncharacterized protein n=1 Tax=Calocera cornea HHB12733 TaxID=1353952 RepID=A0A165JK32_9BASI|nr:hypothetical protein CALCODRAFT_303663 [Calocera cornea HHB12733]